MKATMPSNLPPGVTSAMIENYYGEEFCAICAQVPEECVCPKCPVCGELGNPICYEQHGLELQLYQFEALLDAHISASQSIAAENDYWDEMTLQHWLDTPKAQFKAMSPIERECWISIACAVEDYYF